MLTFCLTPSMRIRIKDCREDKNSFDSGFLKWLCVRPDKMPMLAVFLQLHRTQTFDSGHAVHRYCPAERHLVDRSDARESLSQLNLATLALALDVLAALTHDRSFCHRFSVYWTIIAFSEKFFFLLLEFFVLSSCKSFQIKTVFVY